MSSIDLHQLFLHVVETPGNKVERLYSSAGVFLYNCLRAVKFSKFSIITDGMLSGRKWLETDNIF